MSGHWNWKITEWIKILDEGDEAAKVGEERKG